MSIESKADRVLEQAKRLAERATSWTDFSRALFDQVDGVVAKQFPSDLERQAFFDSPQHEEIQKLQAAIMERIGVVEGAVSAKQKSGRFNVRIPRTNHLR